MTSAKFQQEALFPLDAYSTLVSKTDTTVANVGFRRFAAMFSRRWSKVIDPVVCRCVRFLDSLV